MNQKQLELKLTSLCPRSLEACTDQEIYRALLTLTQSMAGEKKENREKKKLYYISAEFLIGKLLSNNLINLGIYSDIREILERSGKSLSALEELEPEPSLGNGGLGRLAACFLDSIAALGLPGDGVGLNYHYGLFRQKFVHNKQAEEPDPWIQPDSWLIATGRTFSVPFGGFDLTAVLYDIVVPGAGSGCANRLHLFDVERPAPQPWVGISFDKEDIAHRLTSFLYPDDSDEAGRRLRVYQQYFMVSAAAQLIVKELEEQGNAIVLRPSADYGVTRYTHDKELLGRWFDLGYEDTKNRLDMIREFMEK